MLRQNAVLPAWRKDIVKSLEEGWRPLPAPSPPPHIVSTHPHRHHRLSTSADGGADTAQLGFLIGNLKMPRGSPLNQYVFGVGTALIKSREKQW